MATEGWGARLLALHGDDGLWEGGALFPARDGQPLPWTREEGQPWTATAYSLVQLHGLRRRPCRRAHAPRGRAGEGQRPLGARRPAVLRGRGRAVHQRHGRRAGRLLRRGRRRRGRPPGRRAARGRRLELRGRERFRPLVVPHDDQRPGGAARARAGDRRLRRGPSRPDAGARTTSSNGACSGARARARSSTPPGCSSRFRPAGTTTCCVALEYFRAAGERPDAADGRGDRRSSDRSEQPDGTWLLENTWKGAVPFALEDGDGKPSRWNTLRALRVLRWADASAG